MLYEEGVDWYTKGMATVTVYFPTGNCDCKHCPFLGTNSVSDSCFCKFTGEYIEKCDLRGKRGKQCPVHFEETTF